MSSKLEFTKLIKNLSASSNSEEIDNVIKKVREQPLFDQKEYYELLLDKFPSNYQVISHYYDILDNGPEKLKILYKLHKMRKIGLHHSFGDALDADIPLLLEIYIMGENSPHGGLTIEESEIARMIIMDYCGGFPQTSREFDLLNRIACTRKSVEELLDLLNKKAQDIEHLASEIRSNLKSAISNEPYGFYRCHDCGNFTAKEDGTLCKICNDAYESLNAEYAANEADAKEEGFSTYLELSHRFGLEKDNDINDRGRS